MSALTKFFDRLSSISTNLQLAIEVRQLERRLEEVTAQRNAELARSLDTELTCLTSFQGHVSVVVAVAERLGIPREVAENDPQQVLDRLRQSGLLAN